MHGTHDICLRKEVRKEFILLSVLSRCTRVMAFLPYDMGNRHIQEHLSSEGVWK